MLEYSVCNELLAQEGLSLAEQARVARQLGYVGLELAPATLAAEPHRLTTAQAEAIRETVEAEGVRVTGLHWLLSAYPQSSITDSGRREPDRPRRSLCGPRRQGAGPRVAAPAAAAGRNKQ